jgi:lipopolysaccharide/colanic/teichoic acid biosynthesis glycosyltransferase
MMNAQDSQGAFWSPELTLDGGRTFRRGYLILRPETGRSSRYVRQAFSSLRWRLLGITEQVVLFLAVLATAIPVPARATPGIWWKAMTKRSLDLLGAGVGLVLALPFFLVIPILIKLDSPGPIFYFQERVGLDRRRRPRRVLGAHGSADRRSLDRRSVNHSGQVFKLIKFRSMMQNAERSCGPVWASKNDPRVTRLGRFLRRSRIDELPQLVNVLKGEMSLVGPRPERPHFVFKFCDRFENYPYRHRVKPGITGLAQVEQGYDCDENNVSQKVEYDLNYIRRWTPLLDFQILVRTVAVVVTGWGAR